ncbi:MAG TPA: DUF4440 domain-containing protein [Gammaproteobacteria bacterium]|jgi:uncharacterized protein (TIGR02246 family)|nr:DUF4440 domain-containing protein [Gammaproteobacteria bacterium]
MTNHELKQEILAADSAINRKDFDAVSKFYTQDATLVMRPGLLVSGRHHIREAHRRISDYFNGSLDVSQGEMLIIEAGDIALVIAETFVKSPGKPDSEYPAERNAIYVYVKDDQGKWLCAIDNSYGVELLQNHP